MIDLEVAREKALKDAEVAFDKLDANDDGAVELSEVEKLVANGNTVEVSDAKAKIDAFFKTFDSDGDVKVSKSEWLNFYAKLFDDIVRNGLEDGVNSDIMNRL